jgi:hypothetical protein
MTLCTIKEARHKRPVIVWFYLNEISQVGKFIETEIQAPRRWKMTVKGTRLLSGVTFWNKIVVMVAQQYIF